MHTPVPLQTSLLAAQSCLEPQASPTAGCPAKYLGTDGHALGYEQGADEGCFVRAVTQLSLQDRLRVALFQLQGAEVTEGTGGCVSPPKAVTDLGQEYG